MARLLESTADISIVVDVDWRGRYEGRKDHPVGEAEKVILMQILPLKISVPTTSPGEVHGEFIGMMKLSPRGAEVFTSL